MEREDSIRRKSDECKRVNFSEEPPPHSHPHPPGKELVKKDRKVERRISVPVGEAPHAGVVSTNRSFKEPKGLESSPRQQRKFISTWRMACDKTKDRTKELLKKWRTMPEAVDENSSEPLVEFQANSGEHGWSVHVWATWVKRFPSDDDNLNDRAAPSLTETQKEKMSHFFSHVFDMDRDDIISLQDFESFTERIRHFADWSTNSGEYLILEQVQQGFVETFIHPLKPDTCSEAENSLPIDLNKLFLSIEDWLWFWGVLLQGVKTYQEFPIWLQYFPKVIFNAINRSGTGIITRDELSAFYSSVMGFSAQRVGEILDKAYRAMTANGDYKLNYSIYRLCFANFLLGRFPNGPGQYVFGCAIKEPTMFPIDYSAMNAQPEDLECFSLLERTSSNRSSIIV